MQPKTPDERKAILAAAIRAQVMKGGAVQSQSDFDAVVVFARKAPGCIMFVILLIVTCHLYFWYWLITRGKPSKRVMIAVDEFGAVREQKVKV